MLLLTHSLDSILRLAEPNIGCLFQPRFVARVADVAARMPWAADNDCFQGLDVPAFERMLEKIQGHPGCLFVVAPDVVGDAVRTAEWFEDWEPMIHGMGLPVALAAQDGLVDPPWSRFEALFIGGSTGFKLGTDAERLVDEAKARGKWIHMGRVNSGRRMEYAASIGCDSVDGSSWVRWRDTHAKRGLRLAMSGQGRLERGTG